MRPPAERGVLADVPAPSGSVVPIVRPEGLDHFNEALARLVRGHSPHHLRIAVFGDSNLTMDFTSGRLRRRLQTRFGEGGHGFVALGKPWSHYRHMDVKHDVVAGWKAYAISTSPTGDGLYGLGGIAVESQFMGARTFVATADAPAPVGRSIGLAELFYLKRPKGGVVSVALDGKPLSEVPTAADDKALGVARFELEEAPHRLDFTASSWGATRVFGAAIETKQPGVVVDSFGVGSLNTKTLAKHDPKVFGDMLAARDYDLVVFLTGANDCFTMDAVPGSFHKILEVVRARLPGTSILLATPPDRGIRRSFPQTLSVVAQRRVLAEAEHVPLWDQFEAMGGEGSMKHFVQAKLAFGDAVHYTELGGAVMGDRLAAALVQSFDAYLAAHPHAGCGE